VTSSVGVQEPEASRAAPSSPAAKVRAASSSTKLPTMLVSMKGGHRGAIDVRLRGQVARRRSAGSAETRDGVAVAMSPRTGHTRIVERIGGFNRLPA
jgi:hypothetical protein